MASHAATKIHAAANMRNATHAHARGPNRKTPHVCRMWDGETPYRVRPVQRARIGPVKVEIGVVGSVRPESSIQIGLICCEIAVQIRLISYEVAIYVKLIAPESTIQIRLIRCQTTVHVCPIRYEIPI